MAASDEAAERLTLLPATTAAVAEDQGLRQKRTLRCQAASASGFTLLGLVVLLGTLLIFFAGGGGGGATVSSSRTWARLGDGDDDASTNATVAERIDGDAVAPDEADLGFVPKYVKIARRTARRAARRAEEEAEAEAAAAAAAASARSGNGLRDPEAKTAVDSVDDGATDASLDDAVEERGTDVENGGRDTEEGDGDSGVVSVDGIINYTVLYPGLGPERAKNKAFAVARRKVMRGARRAEREEKRNGGGEHEQSQRRQREASPSSTTTTTTTTTTKTPPERRTGEEGRKRERTASVNSSSKSSKPTEHATSKSDDPFVFVVPIKDDGDDEIGDESVASVVGFPPPDSPPSPSPPKPVQPPPSPSSPPSPLPPPPPPPPPLPPPKPPRSPTPPPDMFGGLLPADFISKTPAGFRPFSPITTPLPRPPSAGIQTVPAPPPPDEKGTKKNVNGNHGNNGNNGKETSSSSGGGGGTPPSGFVPLVKAPGMNAEYGRVTAPPSSSSSSSSQRQQQPGVREHLGVVSAFWEVNDSRWRSTKRNKDLAYYIRGLTNLVRITGRSRESMVVYTAIEANTCQSLEVAYKEGFAQSGGSPENEGKTATLGTETSPRFLCLKLPLSSLHYDSWHLAEHSLVQNMPCASSMKSTKLIWLNKINLVESAAHLLMLRGGATATRMEWIDADQFSEIEDGPNKVLDKVSTWNDLPPWSVRESDEFKGKTAAALGWTLSMAAGQVQVQGQGQGQGQGQVQDEQQQPEKKFAVKIVAADGTGSGSVSEKPAWGKPEPGFKTIEGMVYSWDTRKQLPEDELDTWQFRAAQRVAAMTHAHPVLATGGSVHPRDTKRYFAAAAAGSGGGREQHPVSLLGQQQQQQQQSTIAPLPLADRIQIGCYAPKQRVGPCTSNYFVASRFRASVYGIAAMRQAFEDVIFDFEEEFPGPGFKGWNVYNLSWAHVKDYAFDRPGYPAHGFMYAKDSFTKGKTCWSCICSTEEMIYNKMFRRNRQLFNPDRNCDLTVPYEEVMRSEEGTAATSGGALAAIDPGINGGFDRHDAMTNPALGDAEPTRRTRGGFRNDLRPGEFGYAEKKVRIKQN